MILIDIMYVYKHIFHTHVIQVKTEYTYFSLEENKDGCQWPVISYLGLSISSCACEIVQKSVYVSIVVVILVHKINLTYKSPTTAS